jgi:DNA-binding transcriptional LysR family regulator
MGHVAMTKKIQTEQNGKSSLPWGVERIELKHLGQIVQICDAGSITHAAPILGMTQPALSKSIAKLEAQLAVKLFRRTGAGLQPTEYGRLLAERGRLLLNAVLALEQEFESLATGGSGRVRIGFSAAIGRVQPVAGIVPQIVAAFPDLHLDIGMESSRDLLEGVSNNRYDLAFVWHLTARELGDGDLMKAKVIEDKIATVVRPGHPLLSRVGDLTTNDMLEFPIASPGLNPKWISRLSRQQQGNATAINCQDYEVIADCAVLSDIVGVGPRFAYAKRLGRGDLVEIPNVFSERFALWAVGNPEQWGSPVVKKIVRIARKQAQTGNASPAGRN